MPYVMLDEKAIEGSTYFPVLSFKDELGAAMTPNNDLVWSLYKESGRPTSLVVVNERYQVSHPPASTITLVLSGDDLMLVPYESKTRFILVECTYDSSLGDNLPYKGVVVFLIADLLGVPPP